MNRARIAELLQLFLSSTTPPCHSEPAKAGVACPELNRREPAILSLDQLDNISTYIDILLRWNARINLTAVRDPEDIVTRHFGESLFAARQIFPAKRSSNTRVADLGSGAGFPGLPIKLWAPKIALTLIESNHKKATFLREVTRALALNEVQIQNARAQTLPPSSFDFVTLRAVERFTDALPVASVLVATGGRLVLLVSSSQVQKARTMLPTFTWEEPILIPASDARVLLLSKPKEL